MKDLLALLTHEYTLAFYGVVLWQIEQHFREKVKSRRSFAKIRAAMFRSMTWVGLLIVFDDEILAQYNHIAMVDYTEPPKWMYLLLGFLTDIIRSKFVSRVVDPATDTTVISAPNQPSADSIP